MNGRVLVVEDEPKIAGVIAEYLQAAGYVPHCVGDGLAALREAAAQPFDVGCWTCAARAGRPGGLPRTAPQRRARARHHHGHRARR